MGVTPPGVEVDILCISRPRPALDIQQMYGATRQPGRDDTMRRPGDALTRRRVCVPVYEAYPVEGWVEEVVGELGVCVAVFCDEEGGLGRMVMCWVGEDAAAG